MDHLTEKNLIKELKFHARGLDIPEGAADIFIDKTILAVKKELKNKTIITKQDLIRYVTKELQKYNSDLAYVYKNYDKII